ncbi:MAG: transposase [Nitrospirota bacterium]
MKYDPDTRRRRSVRLQGYDYSREGAYFVTICIQDRACLLGEVIDGRMQLNDAGQMVTRWWNESANKFPTIESGGYIIMPNHIHSIIVIVGAALCGCPETNKQPETGQPHRVAPTLGNIIDWFKTMTTNEYIRGARTHGWQPFNGKLWQRNYYEHIIRNNDELNRIREYIINNPSRWAEDENNPANI